MLNLAKWIKFSDRAWDRGRRIKADPSATRADLQIRDLLDYPNLRRAMEIDRSDEIVPEPSRRIRHLFEDVVA